jgi:predicted short-subunit dehydrogenase-like oxidoreductase (DUF2520 family)
MRVVLIGSGNTATVLGRLILRSGHEIVQVFSRDPVHAAGLGALLQAAYTSNQHEIKNDADLYVLAIADRALYEAGSWLQLHKKMVVHTAGSVPMEVLKDISRNYGVLYPLQSLRKEMQHIPDLSLLVNANTEENLALIQDFARSVSPMVYIADDRQREQLHIAAVIVSNFTNHLYSLAADYCKNRDLDFRMLIPLITEVANRLNQIPPQEAQTGPALRKDMPTIQKHLAELKDFPELQRLYGIFTESIQQYYQKQD